MIVAVTGASGQLARKVADLILQRLDPSEVVLVSRTPDALAAFASRGADVRHGDFDEPGTLEAAFIGVERLLLVSAVDLDRRAAQHRAAVLAAAAAGVEHVIYTSIPSPDASNPAMVVPSHRATEEALRESGLEWTFLRNNLYAEFQIPVVEQAIESGRLVTSAADARVAYVSRDDCAAVAAEALVGEGFASQAYDVTGPQAVSPRDVAVLAAELGGAAVEVIEVEDDALIALRVAEGLPEPRARGLARFAAAARGGFLETVTSVVEDLTGSPPRTLQDVLVAGRVGAEG
jgi:NAD(P)H dehydrogenase (quinone)